MKILLIEENRLLAEQIQNQLQAGGLSCDICNTGKDGVGNAYKEDYTLILLNADFLRRDGFSLCKELHTKKNTPLLLFSENAKETDIINGLSAGADDYISAPFSPAVLLAKVKAYGALLERLQAPHQTKNNSYLIRTNGLVIDKRARRVFVNDKEVSMPVREFDLLLFLAENPNIVFSKERIFDRLWGMDAMGDISTVTVHIQRIRDKIERGPNCREYIETVWGAGYRFRGETKTEQNKL